MCKRPGCCGLRGVFHSKRVSEIASGPMCRAGASLAGRSKAKGFAGLGEQHFGAAAVHALNDDGTIGMQTHTYGRGQEGVDIARVGLQIFPAMLGGQGAQADMCNLRATWTHQVSNRRSGLRCQTRSGTRRFNRNRWPNARRLCSRDRRSISCSPS